MRPGRIVRNTGMVALALAVIVFAGLAWMVSQPRATGFIGGTPVALEAYRAQSPVGVPPQLAGADIVARGQYLTRAADCQACHTAKGGVAFAGGRPFKLPFGTIYTPNLTPDRATGIGAWTDADFVLAVHKGIRRDGQRLYPAFPYASYAMLTEGDVLAIKAYLFSLNPVHRATEPNTFAFPFNQRWLMVAWGLMFNREGVFRPVVEQSAGWNRGGYLVEAAGHCGECHTPRNLMQAMSTRAKFGGGVAEGWNAYDISTDRSTGIGAWSADELARYLTVGHAAGRGTASGPMAEVVELSTRHLTPGDIRSMVTYLRSVPAIRSATLPDRLAGPAPARPRDDHAGNPVGRRIFEGACASCHAWSGAGAMRAEAQLTGSRSVNDPSAINVAQMILGGTGPARGGRPYMPAFGAAYSDTEVAAAANYVTARFGIRLSTIAPKDVARMRSDN